MKKKAKDFSLLAREDDCKGTQVWSSGFDDKEMQRPTHGAFTETHDGNVASDKGGSFCKNQRNNHLIDNLYSHCK